MDFIIGFVARQEDVYYIDPTCGLGTFLTRFYSWLRSLTGYRAKHGQFLERPWGFDLVHFPTELAFINLFIQDVQNLSNFLPNMVCDFSQSQPGDILYFPPSKDVAGYQLIQVQMPLFDGFVGNFPFVVRQELIEWRTKGYKKKIVLAIARQWV